MEFDPSQIGIGERYKVLIGSVTPRPIALVSTRSREGRANLAPFSFFCGVGSNPMIIAFCPANNPDGTDKDTLRNIDTEVGGTGEFVVNVVSHAMAPRMSVTAEELPHGESEWDLSGLTMAPARVVAPARVAESPIAMECRVWRVIRTNPGARGGGNMVMGEIVWVHAREGVMDARFHADAAKIDSIGRMGGPTYTRTRDRFDLPPGRPALGFVPGWPAD